MATKKSAKKPATKTSKPAAKKQLLNQLLKTPLQKLKRRRGKMTRIWK